jgi:hypothetical protein
MMKHFANLDEDQENQRLLNNINSISTTTQDKLNYGIFMEFLSDRNLNIVDVVTSNVLLDDVLSKFFMLRRKVNGDKMKRNSINFIKFSLTRTLLQKYKINISNKDSFPQFSQVLKAIMKDLKVDGLGNTTHYEMIIASDLELIWTVLDTNVPTQLQWLAFLIIQLYFCKRGRENIELMTKKYLVVRFDDKGKRFFGQSNDELTKNHREHDVEMASNGRLYEDITINGISPFNVVEKYLSKLNTKSERLWQYAVSSFIVSEPCWFTAKPIGINKISLFMKEISAFCHLSKIYTNHCIRVTTISILGQKFTENEIMSISGHSSASALGI